MATEEDLIRAKENLIRRIHAGSEEPTLGDRLKRGFVEGAIGGAIATGLMVAWDVAINKYPLKMVASFKNLLANYAISSAFIGTMGAIFTSNVHKHAQSVQDIQKAQMDVMMLENQLHGNDTRIQTQGLEHQVLQPQAKSPGL